MIMFKNLFKKLFAPVEVHVQVELPVWFKNYPKYSQENEYMKNLLLEFHSAYRSSMSALNFVNGKSIYFYKVAKDTANFLDIPLWKNITPPSGMSVSGAEPSINRVMSK